MRKRFLFLIFSSVCLALALGCGENKTETLDEVTPEADTVAINFYAISSFGMSNKILNFIR